MSTTSHGWKAAMWALYGSNYPRTCGNCRNAYTESSANVDPDRYKSYSVLLCGVDHSVTCGNSAPCDNWTREPTHAERQDEWDRYDKEHPNR